MNKILLFLIIFFLLISGGIYFYTNSSSLMNVIPSGAPLAKKETPIKEEKNQRYTKEKTIIQSGLEGLRLEDFIASKNGSTVVAFFKDPSADIDEQDFAIVNNDRHKRYRYIKEWDAAISPDGKNVAYRVVESVGSQENEFIVLNNQEGKRYFNVGVIFSPDGQRIAYVVRERGNKGFVVLDGKEGPKYDMVSDIHFSPDSKNITYKATINYTPFLILNNEIIDPKKYDAIRPFFTFSQDSKLVYQGYKKTDDEIFLIIGERETKFPHWIIDIPVFSPDGNKMAYKGKNNEGDFVVAIATGNKIQAHKGAYEDIDAITFSPNSENIAYSACDGEKCFLVINGVREKKYYNKINDIVLSPDSKSFAYSAVKEGEFDSSSYGKGAVDGEFVVINQQEGKHYLRVNSLVFSPDSQKVAYRVLDGDPDIYARFLWGGGTDDLKNDLRESVVVNNIEGEKYLNVTEPIFLEDNTLMYFAYDGSNIYRITETVRSKISSTNMIQEESQSLTQKDCVPIKKEAALQLRDEKTIVKQGLNNKEIHQLHISSDGHSFAHALEENFEEFIVLNGCVSEKYDSVSFVSFVPEVYVAEDQGKEFVIIDGEKQKEYDEIYGYLRILSEGGVAYLVKDNDKIFTVINGKEGKKYDEIDDFFITSDGSKWAYAAKENRQMFIVVNGEEGKKYSDIQHSDVNDIWGVSLSSNGKTLVYAVRGNEQEFGKKSEFVVINGIEGKKYDRIGVHSLKVSPDGKAISYIATDDNKQFVVINGKEDRGYDQVENISMSLDGNVIIYKVEEKSGKEFVVIKNNKTGEKKEGKKYDLVYYPHLSSSGKTIAYIVKEGPPGKGKEEGFLVVNDVEGKVYSGITGLTLSSDGNNVLYKVRDGSSEFMVINDKEGSKRYRKYEIDHLEIVGSYSDNVVYIGSRQAGLDKDGNDKYKYFVGVNHNIDDEYDTISDVVFLGDSIIRYFAYDGENIYRITKNISD